ncbi:thiamine pyrophosphokinase eukaryotic [Penicillium lagena]|uniref:thiamine pyrophosphokinase eukaryotic n=1 Tax=Penicillium lagena TaxID=94218 RepID=UPI00254236BD|nr:thiamine pyrophosphokinase eukaryotic [Penicillium lagena]KAJ5619489.1 thiamine pyrophosphokinase eukaryotic [Penicillium lagena]
MEWHPSRFFERSGSPSPYALLVLNQPINDRAFNALSQHASYIICADGGANRLYDMMRDSEGEVASLPNAIVGDLDSIRPAVREYYSQRGVLVLEDADQYSTDFTKCLKHINSHATEILASPRQQKATSSFPGDTTLEILILGGLGGRVDQAFSQIHHLYLMTQTQRQLHQTTQPEQTAAGGDLYLVSEESITFILQTGRNVIYTPRTRRPDVPRASSAAQAGEEEEEQFFFEENIGIIPLSAPASITTQGFEWDVADWHTEIGGQISTSNHIRAEKVEVSTSVPVLFTLELAARLKRAP